MTVRCDLWERGPSWVAGEGQDLQCCVALEMVALTKRREAELEVAELRCGGFHRVCVSRMDRIENELVGKVRVRRWRWLGCGCGRNDSYVGGIMLWMRLPSKRRRGGSRRLWGRTCRWLVAATTANYFKITGHVRMNAAIMEKQKSNLFSCLGYSALHILTQHTELNIFLLVVVTSNGTRKLTIMAPFN